AFLSYAWRSRAPLARGFQNGRACRFPQLRKPFTELFLVVQALVLFMNVPDRKFCPIPATHAVKYMARRKFSGFRAFLVRSPHVLSPLFSWDEKIPANGPAIRPFSTDQ